MQYERKKKFGSVSKFLYLGVVINKNDGCREEVEKYVLKRRKFESAINDNNSVRKKG